MSSTPGAMPDNDWVLNPKVSALIRYKAKGLAKSKGFSRSDEPDIEQDLRLLLLQKAARFDSSRASIETFASRVIENAVKSMRRNVQLQKCDCRKKVSLDAEVYDSAGKPSSVSQSADEFAGRRHTGQRRRSRAELSQLKLDVADANKRLSPALRDMAALLSHVSPFAAAGVMSISRRQAAVYVDTLRECYEERGLVI
jgi:hypothetical protein